MDLSAAVRRIARDASDLDDARHRLDQLLRRALGYDFAAFSTVDPATGMWTSCYVSGLDASGAAQREQTLFALELSGDVNAFAELSRREIPAATLYAATGGNLTRARRWQVLLEPLSVVDELRAVLRVGKDVWGTLVLYRADNAAPFTSTELTQLTRAVGDIAALFRLMILRLALARPSDSPGSPAGFTVRPDGTLTNVSTAARSWLNSLDDRGRIPAAIRSVVAAARTCPAAAVVSIPSRRGGFATLHGSAIEGSDEVAVVIEPARSGVLSDVLAHAYNLTPREREVAAEAVIGKSPRDIARALQISPFTVTDHLKSLYAKAGVSSRSELIATLLQHAPSHSAPSLMLSPNAWYLDHNVG